MCVGAAVATHYQCWAVPSAAETIVTVGASQEFISTVYTYVCSYEGRYVCAYH